jgi:excisionase family DNA binding protein
VIEFLTEQQLAERLGIAVDKVAEWRRRYGWPHLKIGREVRFTEADVRAIEAQHRVTSERPGGLPGQTALSAARSA